MARVVTIPPEAPFLDTLAAGLLAEAGGDPAALARATILLPTRRAARALGEAFLRVSEGRALLLPRMMPVGDLDADELSLLGDEAAGGDGLDIPPAIPELRRRLMLMRLVLHWGERQETPPLAPGQAAPLAAELARFLDEVQAEGGTLDRLDALAPEEHAEHWQKVLLFLDIVRTYWPEALAVQDCIDPSDRRNRALAAQAEEWLSRPPAHPVIAAGITGGMPAVADLIAAVAKLPQGLVVLPGLARDCDDETWGQIEQDPAHPQHLLALLLRRLELDPAEVELFPLRPWGRRGQGEVGDSRAFPTSPQPSPPQWGGEGVLEARGRLVSEALRPAASSDRWRGVGVLPPDVLAGLRRVDCPTPQAEALVIALLLREALQNSGRTAALITPDRDLARRVAAELRRWGIEIDDSAGVPLNRTPPGVFLRLALDAVAEDLAPVPLLALLKHPLAAGGRAPEAFRALARRLDGDLLRGPRPAPGIAGLEAALRGAEETRALGPFVASVGQALAPLIGAVADCETDLARLVAAHIAAAEALARSDAAPGAARLWQGQAGEAAAQIMAELIEAAGDCPPLAGADYPALFEALIAGPVVRPAYGRHPRLFIWGLLEARLQHADRLVLGGLNEGTWPADAASDPWLSRPMRQAFGMPAPERRIGIAAHDFAQALGAREVYLTRAARVEGSPTVPSRWLMRLDAVLSAGGLKGKLGAETEPLAWQALIDQAERCPVAAPAPRPPVAVRPRRLSVTAIETWKRDPYSIYARHVLRLRPLDPLDQKPSAADRGTFIHKALGDFLLAFPDALPTDALAQLREKGREAFAPLFERPGVRAFWWPRFERIAGWFVGQEGDRRALLTAIAAECEGRLELAGPGGPFALTARADRIDRLRAGGLGIVDFKTGSLPDNWEIENGFAPQLPLEAAIAEAGGFAGVAAAQVTELALWQLSGRNPAGTVKELGKGAAGPRRLIDEAWAGLVTLIAKFDCPDTPYLSEPVPEAVPRYSDYRHLARVKEWSAAGDNDGEAEE